MGIDLKAGGRVRRTGRQAPATKNPYMLLLIKLYRFLARRTDAKFNKVIKQRLMGTRINRPPLSLSKLVKFMDGKTGKTAVIVGPITDDPRLEVMPKMTICALHFTESARARVLAAGGTILTFDQLALAAPKGAGTVLLRGPKNKRMAVKRQGAAGVPHSKTVPLSRGKGRKFEKARGRRRSR